MSIRPPAYASLVDAARNSDLNGVKEWIKRGANVNAANAYGHTPLKTAVNNWADIGVIECLLKNRADVNAVDNGKTVLQRAAFIGNLDAVKLLIKYGAHFDDTLLQYLRNQKADTGNAHGIVSNSMRPEILAYLESVP